MANPTDHLATVRAADHLATVRAALDLAGKATPGEWWQGAVERHHVFAERGNRALFAPEAGRVLLRMNEHFPAYAHDAAAIVALRNAAPAIADLCREVEAGRASIATAESRIASIGAEIDRTLGEHAGGRISALEAARDRIATLEAELAQVRSKLKEAADLFIAIQATDGEEEHRAICDGAALAAKIDAATGAKK